MVNFKESYNITVLETAPVILGNDNTGISYDKVMALLSEY
jgi:hypothetical protein